MAEIDPVRNKSSQAANKSGSAQIDQKSTKKPPLRGDSSDATASVVSNGLDLKELLQAGAHFGHRLSHWHPKMKPFIHSRRGGIYIIDLIKTAKNLEIALSFIEAIVASGKQVLFVGTKKHVRKVVEDAAKAADSPYITERWFGGILTNFATIKKRVKRLMELEDGLRTGSIAEGITKREAGILAEEAAKLNKSVGGLKNLEELPGAIFITDLISDKTAVNEASKLEIPIVAICDTNTDPTVADYPIPANDDAVAAVRLISNLVAEAVKSGMVQRKAKKPEPVKAENKA